MVKANDNYIVVVSNNNVRERPMEINWWKIKKKEGDEMNCKVTDRDADRTK